MHNDWCARGGSRGYVTAAPLVWRIGRKDSDWLLQVPQGFEFESSVPQALRWIWSPDDPQYLLSAAIHDFLLETGHRKDFADSQWFEAALSVGAPRIKTEIARTGMRFRRFGQWAFGSLKGNRASKA